MSDIEIVTIICGWGRIGEVSSYERPWMNESTHLSFLFIFLDGMAALTEIWVPPHTLVHFHGKNGWWGANFFFFFSHSKYNLKLNNI